jgi:hypothetical protein
LILVIFALAGMYFPALEAPYPGWLPPATPEELQASHARRLQNLAAVPRPTGLPEIHVCADGSANLHPIHHDDGEADSAAYAYTPCDAPLTAGPAYFDSHF